MRVLFLDDDEDLREVVSLLLTGLGHECLTLASYDHLVALGERAYACDLAVVDINLGSGVPSGIDAFGWLRQHQFAGRVVFLTGHGRTHPLVTEASRIGSATVLQKPIGIDQLVALLAAKTGEQRR